MKAKIFFADEKVRDTFAELKDSRRTEDQSLVALLDRAFDALSQNAFCGVQIPKKQIPKTYRRQQPSMRSSGPRSSLLWSFSSTL